MESTLRFIGRIVPLAAALLAGCAAYDWQLKDNIGWKKPDTDQVLAEAGIDQALYNSQTELLIAGQHLGLHDPQIAATLEEIARLQAGRGNHAAAAHLRGKAQEIGGAPPQPPQLPPVNYTGNYRSGPVDETLVAHYRQAGSSVNRIASSYRRAGDYRTAESLHLRALRIVEGGLGPRHLALVQILRDYAEVKAGLEDSDAARALLARSVAIVEHNLGDEDPLLAAGLDRIAALHLLDRQFDGSVSAYERALHVRRLHLRADDREIAVNMANLALALSRRGQLRDAADFLERAVSVQQAGQGPHHPDVLVNLEQLAQLYERMGDIELAAHSYERILEVRDRSYGPEHVSIADASLRLADYYRQLDEYELARGHYRRALEVATDALGSGHPDTAAIAERLDSLEPPEGY